MYNLTFKGTWLKTSATCICIFYLQITALLLRVDPQNVTASVRTSIDMLLSI